MICLISGTGRNGAKVKASSLGCFIAPKGLHRPPAYVLRRDASYLFSEVFDLKPTSGLYLKNSAHLSSFSTPRTVSAGFTARRAKIAGPGFSLSFSFYRARP